MKKLGKAFIISRLCIGMLLVAPLAIAGEISTDESAEEPAMTAQQCEENINAIHYAMDQVGEIDSPEDYFEMLQLGSLEERIYNQCSHSSNIQMSLAVGHPNCKEEEIARFCSIYCAIQTEHAYNDCYDGFLWWEGCIQKTKRNCERFWAKRDVYLAGWESWNTFIRIGR